MNTLRHGGYVPESLGVTDPQLAALERAHDEINNIPEYYTDYAWQEMKMGVKSLRDFDIENPEQVKVISLPQFATAAGFIRLSSALRGRALNAHVQNEGGQGASIVEVTNNTAQDTVHHYTESDIELLDSGNYQPIADRIKYALKGLRGAVYLSGGSQGASVSLEIAQSLGNDFDVRGISVVEPTNLVDRTSGDLEKAFKKGGLKNIQDLNGAILDSGVPHLANLQGVKLGGMGQSLMIPRVKQLHNLLKFQKSSKLPDNRALKEAMATNDGIAQLEELTASGTPITIVSGAASNIAPLQVIDYLAAKHADDSNTEVLAVHDRSPHSQMQYGHGILDNILIPAAALLKTYDRSR